MTEETAVIVGVGPGLGAALVKTFSENGYKVFAAARKASALEGVSGPSGRGTVIPVDCDATDPGQVEKLFSSVAAERGPLRVTIFNAGTFHRSSVVDTDPEVFERCWRAGCFGGFLVGRAAARRPDPLTTLRQSSRGARPGLSPRAKRHCECLSRAPSPAPQCLDTRARFATVDREVLTVVRP